MSEIDKDIQQLSRLGYEQVLERSFGPFESFSALFCTLNIIGTVRAFFYIGLTAGGPMAMWVSSLVYIIFAATSAATLAEICSSIPVSGSIYTWAAEAAFVSGERRNVVREQGKQTRPEEFARFVGIIVAWWAAAGWMVVPALFAQQTANYILTLLSLFNYDFPGGLSNNNVKFRAAVWAISEVALLLAVIPNYLTPLWLRRFYRFSVVVMLLDAFICLIWLPIRVKDTYGFQTAKGALLTTYNGTGAPPAWNWALSFVNTAAIVSGYDSAGHVSEETIHASSTAPRSLFWGAILCSVYTLLLTIFFLFCIPGDINLLLNSNVPQPFVLVYGRALGRDGAVFMTALAVLGLICSASAAIIASSRLVYAIARDGPIPLHNWVSRVSKNHMPYNAVTIIFAFCAVLLCTALPSPVAFTSLVSACNLMLLSPYGLIALLRLTITPDKFNRSKFSLEKYVGKFRHLIYVVTVIFGAFIFAVFVSPFYFPVTGRTFNFGCVVFSAITGFGVISWWHYKPWLSDYVRNRRFREAEEDDPTKQNDASAG